MSVWTRTRTQLGIALLGRQVGRASEVITHTEAGAAMPATATVTQEIARIRAIDAFHRSLGWGGYGYNGTVCQSGRAYEGRGAGRSGAHTVGQNSKPAIVVLGHGDRTPMSAAAIVAHRRVQQHWIAAGHLAQSPKVTGHRDYTSAKTCPGNRIYPQLPQLRGVTTGTVTTPPPPKETEPDVGLRDWTKASWNKLRSRVPAIGETTYARPVDRQELAWMLDQLGVLDSSPTLPDWARDPSKAAIDAGAMAPGSETRLVRRYDLAALGLLPPPGSEEAEESQARVRLATAWYRRAGVWMDPTASENPQVRLTRLAREVAFHGRTVFDVVQHAPARGSFTPPEVPVWVVLPSVPWHQPG